MLCSQPFFNIDSKDKSHRLYVHLCLNVHIYNLGTNKSNTHLFSLLLLLDDLFLFLCISLKTFNRFDTIYIIVLKSAIHEYSMFHFNF